jgi:hypothetical protein
VRGKHGGRAVMLGNLLTGCLCEDCGRAMTMHERHYYAFRCEACEKDNHERIQRWRKGGEDAELDAAFSGPTPTRH